MDIEITILTATLNAEAQLPGLIRSLRQQTDKKFRWIVVDGCSTDGTERLVHAASADLDVLFTSQKDAGIYDALNRGLRHIQNANGYYLVLGADDTLEPGAVENFRKAARNGAPDFIAASIRQGGRIISPRKHLGWLFGMQGIASSHAVGLLIKRGLHDRFGHYSTKFPIAADQLFVKNAIRQNATVMRCDFLAGTFGTQGTTGMDGLGVLTEIFRVQVRTEKMVWIQYIIFGLRLGKYCIRSIMSGRGGR